MHASSLDFSQLSPSANPSEHDFLHAFSSWHSICTTASILSQLALASVQARNQEDYSGV